MEGSPAAVMAGAWAEAGTAKTTAKRKQRLRARMGAPGVGTAREAEQPGVQDEGQGRDQRRWPEAQDVKEMAATVLTEFAAAEPQGRFRRPSSSWLRSRFRPPASALRPPRQESAESALARALGSAGKWSDVPAGRTRRRAA